MLYPTETGWADAQKFFDEALAGVRADGLEPTIVSTGGTPNLKNVGKLKGATEHRPGTYIYNDRMQVAAGVAEWDDCALNIYSTVVSRAGPDRGILDAGSKTLTSDTGGGLDGHGLILEHPEAKIARFAEEHGFLDLARSNTRPVVGDVVRIVPNHVCVVVNMMDEVVMVRGDEIIGMCRSRHGGSCGDRSVRRERSDVPTMLAQLDGGIASLTHPTIQPLQRTPPRRSPRRKRRLQQIAAGRRFPIQHLAGREHAGQTAEHEIGIEFIERDPARGRDRARDRGGAGEFDRNGVDQAGEIGRRHRRQRNAGGFGGLLQQADRDRRKARGLAQEIGQRLLALRRRQLRDQIVRVEIGPQGDVQGRPPRTVDRLAQIGRQRIDRAALDAGAGDDGFAATVFWPDVSATPFSGCPSKRSRKMSDQATVKPELAGRSGDILTPLAASVSAHDPSEPSRGQLAPPSASTVACGLDDARSVRCLKTQTAVLVPAGPAMAQRQLARPSNPAAAAMPAARATP